MSDTSQGDGWWQASDSKWYPPSSAPATTVPAPPAATAISPASDFKAASAWIRLGAAILDSILWILTLGIGWLIWAAVVADDGQTPAKRLLGLTVIDSSSMQPVGIGRMFWARGVLAGIVSWIVIPLTLGILVLMPFWDKQNQNLWDKISSTYVIRS